jgi:hypothetical protein
MYACMHVRKHCSVEMFTRDLWVENRKIWKLPLQSTHVCIDNLRIDTYAHTQIEFIRTYVHWIHVHTHTV